VTLKINFCMMRGKPSFGGVPPSEHPGKIIIRHTYAPNENEVRSAITTALYRQFKPNPHLSWEANKFFEKWIDIKPSSNLPLRDLNSGRLYKEFTVYLYLTK